jgi:methylenetetrahydrofolate dehydrogenase (NADP+)/methenyltetrahydrofolate cyclohydrolase
MTKIIEGNSIAKKILADIKSEIEGLKIRPKLAIISYNPDKRSRVYIDLKIKKAKEIGIECEVIDWSGKDLNECKNRMQILAEDNSVNAIIVQLPMLGLDNFQEVLDLIPPSKDVDGLSAETLDSLKNNKQSLIPATPKAILEIIEQENIDFSGKNILVVGQGKLVGLPLSIILKNKGYDVTTADNNTKNLKGLAQYADIIISATGSPKLLKGDMIKLGSIVLDAGAAEASGKIVGDVDYESVEPKTSAISKVPGGIGPVTVACLLENVLQTSKNSQ